MRAGWFSISMLAAGCGFSGFAAGPDAGVVDAHTGQDSALADAARPDGDAGSTSRCLGPASTPWEVCFADQSGFGDVVLPPTLNTDTSNLCLGEQPAGWGASQPEACFVVGKKVRVMSTRAIGRRPLVIVGLNEVEIMMQLDLSSPRSQDEPGAGSATPEACGTFERAPQFDDSDDPAGGGAGGTFTTQGGAGGAGVENDGDQARGGLPAPAIVNVDTLRGGCDGQQGGLNDRAPGRGGGAVYVVAGSKIHGGGRINASGGGATAKGSYAGGNGGGSGGMIVLHAPEITVNHLVANGGGGSAGAGSGGANNGHGGEPMMHDMAAPGGSGGAGAGGTGGAGYALGSDASNGDTRTDRSGGGGGGGAGYIRANRPLTGRISPPLVVVP